MKQHSYIKNAAILTATGIGLRIAGMAFRVYLAAVIGATGMGLYQLISTVYGMAVTFATAGLSVIATRITAAALTQSPFSNVRAAMRRVLCLALALGVGSAVLLYACAEPVASLWLKDARAVVPLRALAPSLPFMALSACLRGYFMARRQVGPNARAQIFEQIVRLALVACIITPALEYGLAAACTAVVLGNTISEALSWAYMQLCYRKARRQMRSEAAQARCTLGGLGALLAPIAGAQYLTGVLRTVENVLVPMCLALFLGTQDAALAQYGALKGMAMPVLFFPFSFISTLATLLLPEITAAYEQKQTRALQHLIRRVMLLTLSISVLAGGMFTTFAYPIGEVLYHSREIGLYLAVLGPLAPLMYLESMVDGILKGMNEQVATLRYTVLDSVMRIALIWVLLPRFGMWGFLFVMVMSNLLTSLLNLIRLLRVSGVRFDWMQWLVKPLLAAAVAAPGALLVQRFLGLAPATVLATVVGGAVYVLLYAVCVTVTGGVSLSDFKKDQQKQKE